MYIYICYTYIYRSYPRNSHTYHISIVTIETIPSDTVIVLAYPNRGTPATWVLPGPALSLTQAMDLTEGAAGRLFFMTWVFYLEKRCLK